ncbi:hypothetical protein LCGC14_2736930 [marine sediment metagenome]|uniref:Uncharacterized protein n=1 Tax=marine sediment metagenome TaxID=412755 RepID=A0A0F9BEI6_9ZZZZ
MKLKTLKDFEEKNDGDYISTERFAVNQKLLAIKQEAIKDIKAIRDFEKSQEDKLWEDLIGKKIVYSEEAKIGIINYIKWKFNISEEDLK